MSDDLAASCARSFIRSANAASILLFDNYPGRDTQVPDFLSALEATYGGFRLIVVALDAPDCYLRRCASLRRVCDNCERDPLGDARMPAHGTLADLAACRTCGQKLRTRTGDQPTLFEARLARYRRNVIGLRMTFHRNGIEVVDIDAAMPSSLLMGQVTALEGYERHGRSAASDSQNPDDA